MRAPNLNTLRSFEAAARHLNFRAAAEELHVTQGAVAQQVRRLEQDLGRALFLRHARGLTLTPEGRGYAQAVAKALAGIAEATQALHTAPHRVTISVTPSLASKWLVPRLARFAEDHPEIELRTIASEALMDLERDGVDIALRQGPRPTGAGLRVEKLSDLELCAVAEPGRRVAQTQEAIAQAPLIQDGHAHWERLLPAPLPRMLQFNQTALAIDAAATGQGVALAPRILVQGDVEAGRLSVLWRDARAHPSAFYLVARQAPSEGARQAVIDWLLREAQSA